MIHVRNGQRNRPLGKRNRGLRCAFLALGVGVLLTGTACNEDEAWDAFRSAASTNLEAGVDSLMDGVVDGLFAAIDLGTDQSSDTGSTGSGS